jgi:hypothetical protein
LCNPLQEKRADPITRNLFFARLARLGNASGIDGLQQDKWALDPSIVAQGWQRHLFQAGFTDLLGRDTFIPQAAMPKFTAAKIDKPDEFYYGKTIHVTGTVTLNREKPQITVTDPAQIKIVTAPAGRPVVLSTLADIRRSGSAAGSTADSRG